MNYNLQLWDFTWQGREEELINKIADLLESIEGVSYDIKIETAKPVRDNLDQEKDYCHHCHHPMSIHDGNDCRHPEGCNCQMRG
jgi:hypothetical protein